nr:spore germination protein [Neobacillus sp. Marseille-Q6967]
MLRNRSTERKKTNAEENNLNVHLLENVERLKEYFGEESDLSIRFMNDKKLAIVYLDSLTNKDSIEEHVLEDLFKNMSKPLEEWHITTKQSACIDTFEKLFEFLVQGYTIVLKEGERIAIAANTAGGERRTVSESNVESVVRGPRESFNESLMTNIGLVRKRIHSGKLKVAKLSLGKVTKTPIAILYIEGVAKEEIYKEVKSRLEKIDIDGILDSLYIEEMIEDPRGYTPFPTIFNSERPDRIAAGLLEGRVGILVDGTPAALLVPSTIGLFLTSNEDYYQRYDFSSFLKLLRSFTFLLSFVLPGFYVAVLTYHQEMIPTPLLIALTGQREGVPYGVAVEILLMELTFEILREASLRLPKTIGAAVSIVGGLVLGQAAVDAGLVGQATVIVVSLTAICSFTTPSYNLSIASRLIRFSLIILSAVLGAFGLIFGLIFIFVHLNTLRSFSVPYLSPLVPVHKENWRDVFVRTPWWNMKKRPTEIAKENQTRLQDNSRDST